MSDILDTPQLARALAVRDLSDPARGPHAMQLLADEIVDAVAARWSMPARRHRPGPVVTVADNYDRLGYAPDDVTRDARYTRYLGPDVMLRSHTSSGMPPVLRAIAAEAPRPYRTLHAVSGICHRRDTIDRLHVGTPHQLDLWRVEDSGYTDPAVLRELAETLVGVVRPGARWQLVPATHPYNRQGAQLDVEVDGEWVELAECGLIHGGVLRQAGLDPRLWTGTALGMGLDRALMLRKGVPDIRMLRSADPRVAAQLQDLEPWRPVSSSPPVRRDVSIVVGGAVDAELLGDRVREALGERADELEAIEVLAATPAAELPATARERLRIGAGQRNLLVRLTLRPLAGTLTDAEANRLRDLAYLAMHEGEVLELIG